MDSVVQAEQEITKELSLGERLLWVGRPKQGIVFRASDIFLIPFSLLWCGFAIFWEATAIQSSVPFSFQLWGIAGIIIGMYIVFGRFVLETRQRTRTYYGLTNERAIIVSGLFTRAAKSLNLRTLTDVFLAERLNGVGTISFGRGNPIYSWFGYSSRPGFRQNVPCFDSIENAKDVSNRIRNA